MNSEAPYTAAIRRLIDISEDTYSGNDVSKELRAHTGHLAMSAMDMPLAVGADLVLVSLALLALENEEDFRTVVTQALLVGWMAHEFYTEGMEVEA
jgi:hypothetical protein